MAHVYVTVPYIWIILFIYQHSYIVICIKASLYSVRYIQYVGDSPMNSGSPGCWSPSEAPHTHTPSGGTKGILVRIHMQHGFGYRIPGFTKNPPSDNKKRSEKCRYSDSEKFSQAADREIPKHLRYDIVTSRAT